MTLFSPMHASAAEHNCGAYGNLFAGYTTGNESTAYEGVSAKLTARGILLCGTDTSTGLFSTNFSSSWTMVNSADGTGYAQSGYFLHFGDTCVRWYAEQRRTASDPFTRALTNCVGPGEVHTAWQQEVINGTAYNIRSNIDTTIILQTNWDPFQYWASPFSLEFNGETYHPGSDVPGTPSAPTDFSGIQAQLLSNDQFVNIGSGGYYLNYYLSQPHGSRYAGNVVSSNEIQTWTPSPN